MEQFSQTAHRAGRAEGRSLQIVSRIDAFLLEHLDQSICMAQLCDVTGVSERSVRNACHAVCGTSPKRYVTRRRMEAVHHALELADPSKETVTRIATDYGFFELGRFAGLYTSLFGQRPSDTLRSGAEATMSAA